MKIRMTRLKSHFKLIGRFLLHRNYFNGFKINGYFRCNTLCAATAHKPCNSKPFFYCDKRMAPVWG